MKLFLIQIYAALVLLTCQSPKVTTDKSSNPLLPLV